MERRGKPRKIAKYLLRGNATDEEIEALVEALRRDAEAAEAGEAEAEQAADDSGDDG